MGHGTNEKRNRMIKPNRISDSEIETEIEFPRLIIESLQEITLADLSPFLKKEKNYLQGQSSNRGSGGGNEIAIYL